MRGPRKLVELDPMWMDADGRERMGFVFQCPGCIDLPFGSTGRGHYVAVYFKNPIDGGAPASERYAPKPRWERVGETFETLTIKPSIAIRAPECWHGWVTSGEVTTC